MKKSTSLLLLPVALLALSLAETTTKADETIVSDSLQSSTSADIVGTKPADRGGTGAAPYTTGGGTFTITSTGAVPTGGKFATPLAEIAVPAITAGHIYTLTVTVDLKSGNNGTNDGEVGFDNSDSAYYKSGQQHYINSPSGPLFAVSDAGSSILYENSDRDQNQYRNNGKLALSGPNTLKLVLNTQGTYWTISAFINSKPNGSHTYGASDPNPTINEIFIGSQGSLDVAYSNLSLTQSAAP